MYFLLPPNPASWKGAGSLHNGPLLRKELEDFFPHMLIPAPPEVPKVYMGARSGGPGHQSTVRERRLEALRAPVCLARSLAGPHRALGPGDAIRPKPNPSQRLAPSITAATHRDTKDGWKMAKRSN